jgi:MoaA/NifB/PqqE/SkfB family radical SAM enzyme
MRWDTLEIILDELSAQKFDGSIHPYLNGEPLCDDRILDIIRLIRKRFPNNTIFLSTNGDYLEKFTPDKLFKAGVTFFQISDWDQDGKFIKYDGYKDIDVILKDEVTWWYNRGGNIDVKSNSTMTLCTWVFEKLYINFMGDIIVCCSDFYNKYPYGNILSQGLMNVWLSDLYKYYRINHFLHRGKKLLLCDKCNKLIEVSQEEILYELPTVRSML